MNLDISIDDIRDKYFSLNQTFGQRLAMLTLHDCDIDSDKYLKEIKRGIESTKWFLQHYGAWSASLEGGALRILKPYYKHAMEVRNERILARIEQREERPIEFDGVDFREYFELTGGGSPPPIQSTDPPHPRGIPPTQTDPPTR